MLEMGSMIFRMINSSELLAALIYRNNLSHKQNKSICGILVLTLINLAGETLHRKCCLHHSHPKYKRVGR